MKLALLKVDIKNNAVLLLIFCGVLSMYLTMMAYMFDPTSVSSLSDMMDLLPSDLVAALGFDTISSDLTGFIASFYYGFLIFAFPMVFYIILTHRLVAKMVDNGSFAYLLLSPTSRRQIIFTQGVFLLMCIVVLFLVVNTVGVVFCRIIFGELLNEQAFFRLNVSMCLLTMAMAMIAFFYSCFFMDSKRALAFGAGVPIAFLLLFLMGGVSEEAETMKNLSLFSIVDAGKIVEGESTLGINLALICMILILFVLSIYIFEKKKLPL